MKKILLLVAMLCIAGTQNTFAQAACTGARTDIWSMSSTDRLSLRNAIIAYLSSQVNTSVPSTSPDYYTNVAHHAAHFSTVHFTGTSVFFKWHRYYIQEMEHWFLEHGYRQFVPLPSWNPNNNSNLPNEFFNSNSPGRAIVNSTAYPDLASQTTTPNSNAPYLVPTACGTTSENTYSNNVEMSYHNDIHVDIGGTMNTAYSSASAIFWTWHGYIDDLWFCYQRSCQGLTSDLYVKKYATDAGATPVPSSVQLWTAPDIWVRNTPDGFQNQTSEDLTNTSPGDLAYVYVKVMNRGQAPHIDNTGDISVYWAQGSVGVQWPNPWTGGTTINCGGIDRPLGGPIGTQNLRRVNEDFVDNTHTPVVTKKDYYIYEFEWDMPDPDNYSCFSEVWQQQHFCILARMDDGNGTPTGTDIYNNMTQSNNIAMRNITVLKDGIGTPPGVPRPAPILWGNYTDFHVNNTQLFVRFETPEDAHLLGVADLTLTVDNETLELWSAGGGIGEGIERDGNVFKMLGDNSFVGGFSLPENTIKGLTVTVAPHKDQKIDREYRFHLVQYNDDKIASGEQYIVMPSGIASRPGGSEAGNNRIENTATVDGEYHVYPNPATNSFAIHYSKNDCMMNVSVFDLTGRELETFKNVSSGKSLHTGTLPSGTYLVRITNQKSGIITTQRLVINR